MTVIFPPTQLSTWTVAPTGRRQELVVARALPVLGLKWPFMKTILGLVLAVTSAASATTIAPVLAQDWVLTGAPSTNWSCVASSADGTKLVAAVNPGLIYLSTNAGEAWTPTTAPSTAWKSVASSADGTKLVAASAFYDGTSGQVYRSVDSGAHWQPSLASDSDGWISVASSADGSTLAAAGDIDLVHVSTNSGATWTDLAPGGIPTSARFPAVASSADGHEMVVAEVASVGTPVSDIVATPSSAWVESPPGVASFSPGLCTSLAMSADGTRVAATIKEADAFGAGSTNCASILLTWLNSGATKIPNCTSVSNWTSVATSADGIRLAAVASSGDVYTSTNGGVTWAPNIVTNVSWSGVASSADGAKIVAVASGGGIYTWQTTPTPTLNINRTGEDLQISWLIPSMSFVLQQSADLGSTNWTAVESALIVNLTNLQNQVTLSPPSHPTFYRLSSTAP